MDKFEISVEQQKFEVEIKSPLINASGKIEVLVNGKPIFVKLPGRELHFEDWHFIEVDSQSFELDIDPELRWIKSIDGLHRIELSKPGESVARPASGDGRIKAPIPGLITKVFVEPGQAVNEGDSILILEAMKMENVMSAPKAGVVGAINVSAGKTVSLGDVLVYIE